MFGTFGEVHAAQGDAYGAGGDDYYTVAVGDQLHCCFDYDGEDGEERFVRGFGDDGARSCAWWWLVCWRGECVGGVVKSQLPSLMTMVRCFFIFTWLNMSRISGEVVKRERKVVVTPWYGYGTDNFLAPHSESRCIFNLHVLCTPYINTTH